jgi:hypothetical protein
VNNSAHPHDLDRHVRHAGAAAARKSAREISFSENPA